MAAIEEFSVGYPVKFWTGGDTTRDAFGKLIQEIERIYGILNALGTGKASYDEIASAVSSHKYETNPHPNWKPSMSFYDLAGNVNGDKVIGSLPNANIDAGKVNGLEDYVKGLIPDTSGNNESGITDSSLNDSGYIKFGNGLMFQWGIADISANTRTKSGVYGDYHYANFFVAFPSKCLSVTATPVYDSVVYTDFIFCILENSLTTGDFGFRFEPIKLNTGNSLTDDEIRQRVKISYFAVGV